VLHAQFQTSVDCWLAERKARATQAAIQSLRRQISDRRERASDDLKKELSALDEKLAAIEGAAGERRRRGQPRAAEPSLGGLAGEFASLTAIVQSADTKPTDAVLGAVPAVLKSAASLQTRFQELRTTELPTINGKLREAAMPEVTLGKRESP
jgi:hypothetical protein